MHTWIPLEDVICPSWEISCGPLQGKAPEHFFSQKYWGQAGILSQYWGFGTRSVEIEIVTEGNLEVNLVTIWRDGKAEVARLREEKKEDQRRERTQLRHGYTSTLVILAKAKKHGFTNSM